MSIRLTIILSILYTFAFGQSRDTIIVGANYVGSNESIDNQDLTLLRDTLYIENANYVDLKPYLDNTDQQQLNYFSLDTATSMLYVGLQNGDTISVSLADLQLIGLQEQLLSLVNDSIYISNGNGVSLAPYINTDAQDLGHSDDNDTLRTITITGGASTQISVADLDNDPTNELYDDTAVFDSIVAANTRINNNYAAILLRVLLPDPACTDGELMKWNNISQKFECATDQTVGEADGRLENVYLNSRTLSFDATEVSIPSVVFTNWDTLDTDDLTINTNFSGDVTGPYNNTVVVDDSHSHTISTLPTILSSIENVSNDGNNIDLVEGPNIQIASNDSLNTITISATVVTDLNRVVADEGTYGVNATSITSSSGTDVFFQGDTTSGYTRVNFKNSGLDRTVKVGVLERDPNVPEWVKLIDTTDIARWNAFDTEAEIDSAVANNNYTGPQGPQGVQGIQGVKGDKPSHQWSGTQLRFENPNGSWGSYVNLKGDKGDMGASLLIIEVVADSNALPLATSYTGAVGDIYVASDNGHAWVYRETPTKEWFDIGQILTNEVRSISMQYSGRSQPVTVAGESQALYIVGAEMDGRYVYEATFRFPDGAETPSCTIQMLQNGTPFVTETNVTDNQVYNKGVGNVYLEKGDVLSINITNLVGTFAGGITVTLSTKQ